MLKTWCQTSDFLHVKIHSYGFVCFKGRKRVVEEWLIREMLGSVVSGYHDTYFTVSCLSTNPYVLAVKDTGVKCCVFCFFFFSLIFQE